MNHQGQLHPFMGHLRYHATDPWEATHGQPLRLFNQHFGNGIKDEDLPPLDTWAMMHPHKQIMPNRDSAVSQINCSNDEFQVKLDVHQFHHPSELKVSVVDGWVVVTGTHAEKPDEHGWISRNFKRRYRLPENYQEDRLVCNLSVDGILQIRVPREAESHHDPTAPKQIPIHQTGRPAATFGVQKLADAKGHHFHSLH